MGGMGVPAFVWSGAFVGGADGSGVAGSCAAAGTDGGGATGSCGTTGTGGLGSGGVDSPRVAPTAVGTPGGQAKVVGAVALSGGRADTGTPSGDWAGAAATAAAVPGVVSPVGTGLVGPVGTRA